MTCGKICRSKSTNQSGEWNAFLICAFRSADFPRWCLSPERNLTHNLIFLFQTVFGIKVARPSCDVDGQWSPAGPEANRDRAGPRFRVQHTAPWPIHWMLRSCTEPDGVWSPYLGRLGTVSMTAGDSLVRRAKTSTVTPIFFFLSSKRNVSGRFWRILQKILGTVFLLQRFGLVNPWTCNWNTYKSLQKTEGFDLSFWKNEHGDPQFFSHIWNSHETKDRYWKNQPISR